MEFGKRERSDRTTPDFVPNPIDSLPPANALEKETETFSDKSHVPFSSPASPGGALWRSFVGSSFGLHVRARISRRRERPFRGAKSPPGPPARVKTRLGTSCLM
jgi:hypothetical protein